MAEGGWADEDPNLIPSDYTHTAYYNQPVIPIEGLERDAYYRAPTYQLIISHLQPNKRNCVTNCLSLVVSMVRMSWHSLKE